MDTTTTGQALYQWREWAIQQAKANNIDSYEVDWLLQGVTSLTSTALRLETYLTEAEIEIAFPLPALSEKWQQRITHHVPVQYLVGETPWRHYSLTVSPDVLIPRPETELIVSITQSLAADVRTENSSSDNKNPEHWADLGTGSGAIAIALAHTFPTATIHAVDISPPALQIAQHNAKKNKATNITFHQGSWLTPLTHLKGQLSGIITNPPYIQSQTVLTLQPEVTQHEPHLALDGGTDGLSCIRALITHSPPYLKPGGLWLTELMAGQAQTVATLLQQQGTYTLITIHPDLSGTDRFVSARKAL